MMRLPRAVRLSLLIICLCAAGCGARLIDTPTLCAAAGPKYWSDVPASRCTNTVDVIYATDRARDTRDPKRIRYGFERSGMLAFGEARVTLGPGTSWDGLVAACSRTKRDRAVPVMAAPPRECGQFPRTPWPVGAEDGHSVAAEETRRQVADAEHGLHELIAAQMSQSTEKEALVFIHGFHADFEEAVEVLAQLWHFLGRRGVPIVYSWPAGWGLSIRGYNYDRESGEFTIFHLKLFLETLARTPGLERINIIAHSRGTEVLMSALRELNIKYTAADPGPRATARALRIGHVVLAAPDIDINVAQQRMQAEMLHRVCHRLTIYTAPDDLALALARWLFASTLRLGTLGLVDLSEPDRLQLSELGGVDLIDVRVSNGGTGHSYIYASPAVTSDLILLLRYGLAPGDAGRPLEKQNALWIMRDGYPAAAPPAALMRQPTTAPAPRD